MERRLKKHWREFCETGIKRSLKKFKNNDGDYKQFIVDFGVLTQRVDELLSADDNLKSKDVRLLKNYIKNMRAKEEYELPVIYSQGVCDGVSLNEKFR